MIPAASLLLSFENSLPVLAFLRWLLYAGIVFFSARKGRDGIIVLASMVFYALQDLPALGDALFLQTMYEQGVKRIWASEPVTHLLLTQTLSPQTLRLFVPPLMGGLSVWLWLKLPDLRPIKGEGNDRSVRALLIAAIPLQMVFYRGYVESMMIAVPAGLVFLHCLFRAVDRSSLQNVLLAAAALGMAVLIHGVYFFWLPALPLFLLISAFLKDRSSTAYSALYSLLFIAVVLGIYAGGLGLIQLLGFELDWMNARGGGDQKAFVSFEKDPANPFIAYTFASKEHVVAVLSILVYAAPALPVMLVSRGGRLLADRLYTLSARDIALVLLTLAFTGFVTLWNFDLGFFWDFDLIFSLSIPLALLTERMWRMQSAYSSVVAVLQTMLWMLAFSRFF